MMKIARLAIIIAFVAILAVPSVAKAVCMINVYGVLYLDTDCDKIIDYDDMEDADFDGIPDGNPVDNCPNVRNGDCDLDILDCDVNENGSVVDLELSAGHQIDWNDDGIGDACDDADLDGITDYMDNCRSVFNPTQDPAFCTDTDGDRFEDPIDNCPEDYNTDQLDSDNDGIGDWCDNCRNIYNPAQNDIDCPQDDGSSGGLPPNYNTNPPSSDDGFNYDYGNGTVKGNGYGNNCSFTAVAGGSAVMPAALMLLAIVSFIPSRRRRK